MKIQISVTFVNLFVKLFTRIDKNGDGITKTFYPTFCNSLIAQDSKHDYNKFVITKRCLSLRICG